MPSENLKTALAAWGALTGTVGITISVIALLRDRSRLRLDVSYLSREDAEKVHPELANLNCPSYVFAEIANVGRRVRYVYQPEIWRAKESGHLVYDGPDSVFFLGSWSRAMGLWQSWRLEEGQTVTYVFGDGSKDRVVRIDLADSLARKQRYYAPRGRLRWYYGRWQNRKGWKFMRETFTERERTRHHDDD
jgi:hypothetical protein